MSPIFLEITFKRKPVTSRYETLRGKRGARLMNYFTQTLKFTVDKAALNFSGWKEHNIKGPPDRIKVSRLLQQDTNGHMLTSPHFVSGALYR